MIGYYNYTVILTYIGNIFGFVGITLIWGGNLKMSLVCLMIAGLCDMFDGTVAATKKRTNQEKSFGIQIDSLSDLICFAALPALIGYQCSDKTVLPTIISALFLLCGLIRLAWFNVDEAERQSKEEGGRKYYLGLPVTTSATLLPLFMGIAHLADLPTEKITPWVLLPIAIAFISPFRLKKPQKIGKVIMGLLWVTALTLVIVGVKA